MCDMFFMDFINNPIITAECRYFLSGDNGFLKEYVIEKVARAAERRITRLSSVKEMLPEAGLFDEHPLYILGSKSNPKHFQDFTIKLSSSHMGKTFEAAGFIEISCGNLFPNQVKQFAVLVAAEYGLKREWGSALASSMHGDPYSIVNSIRIVSYVKDDLRQSKHLPFTVDYLTNYLGAPETYQIVDMFIAGDYSNFLREVESLKLANLREVLWSLLGALLRLQKAHLAPAMTWYQKKLAAGADKIAPYGFASIISYVNTLCNSYDDSPSILFLQIQRLIFYLRGFPLTL